LIITLRKVLGLVLIMLSLIRVVSIVGWKILVIAKWNIEDSHKTKVRT